MGKISDLPLGTSVNGEELLVLVQNGDTRKVPFANLFNPAPLDSAVTALQQATDNGVAALADALAYVRGGMLLDFASNYFRASVATAVTLAALGVATAVQADATAAIEPGGSLVAVAADDPRASQRGLLVEAAATNLFRFASQIAPNQSPENNGWIKTGNNITVTANAAPDPAGGTTATRLTPTSATGQHRVHQINLGAVTAGNSYSISGFFKADGYRRVYLQASAASGFAATADLISGTVTSATGISGEAAPATTLIALANGWYYFAASGTLTNPGNNGVQLTAFVIIADDSGVTSFAGDTGKSLLMFRPMLNAGLAAQTFVDRNAAVVTRAADQLTLAIPAGNPADEILVTHGDNTPTVTLVTRAALASANELRLHSDAGAPWLGRPIRRIELRSASAMAAAIGGQLKAAVRSLGFYPRATAALPANDLPTLTLGAGAAASAIDGTSIDAPRVNRNDTRLTYLSGVPRTRGTTYPQTNYYVSRGAYYGTADGTTPLRDSICFAYEFVHTGTQFEIPIFAGGGTGTNYRVLVNGHVAGTLAIPLGSHHYIRHVFPASGTRTIRIESYGLGCNGVHVASSGEIATSGRAYPLVTFIGDSFWEGTGSEVGDISSAVIARALGFNCALAAVGGTGLINPGGNNTAGQPKVAWTNTERLRDLTLDGVTDPRTGAAVKPAMGIVAGTLNDEGVASGTWSPFGATLAAAIANRTEVLIDAWLAVNAGRPLVFLGPVWPSGQPNNRPSLNLYRVRDGMMQAALGRAGQNVHFIDRLQGLRREGVYSTSTDQAFLYTGGAAGTDPVHPTPAGHRLDGLTDAAALRQLILALA